MGWYDPSAGVPFNFAAIYGQAASLKNPDNTVRQALVEALLKETPAIVPSTLMKALRSHFEGTAFDHSRGYEVSPHKTDVRTVCRDETEASFVAQLRDGLPAPIGGVLWICLKTPCAGAFVPWYLGTTRVPDAYATGTQVPTEGSAYWDFARLVEWTDDHYRDAIGEVQARFGALEKELLESQDAVERRALELYAKDPAAACASLSDRSCRAALEADRLAREIYESKSGRNSPGEPAPDRISISRPGEAWGRLFRRSSTPSCADPSRR